MRAWCGPVLSREHAQYVEREWDRAREVYGDVVVDMARRAMQAWRDMTVMR